jgi:superfamily I DNA/RNA helicase
MQWSHYSNAIFDAYLHTADNLKVEAVPGSGKTTNIQHMWGLTDKQCLYLVFNKQNQVEAEGKLAQKQDSTVLTLNGLGHRIIARAYPNIRLDTNKVKVIARKYKPVPESARFDIKKKLRKEQWSLIKAVDTAKIYDAVGTLSLQDYEDMVATYDLDVYPGMYNDIVRCLELSDKDTTCIDFADQIRWPALFNLTMPHFDHVLCDEVQDFSPVQAQMVRKIKADKFVFVGDTHQSIYGFRGAMSNAMEYLAQQFNTVELPLSICYRCGTEVVQNAQRIYREIEPWTQNHRGVVRYSTVSAEAFNAATLIMCRFNKPLIELAYRLLQQGKPCYVRGRDIGTGLVALVRKQQASTVGELRARLELWRESQISLAHRKEDEVKAQRITDQYDSLMVFCGQCRTGDTVDAVGLAIDTLFEQGRGVCLTTVHKAKGLEARRAMLLEPELFAQCRGRAQQQWQVEQERNVEYVAVTRAQQELIYLL